MDYIEQVLKLLEEYKQDYVRAYVRLHNDISIVAGTDNIEELKQLNEMAVILDRMIAVHYVRQAGYYLNNDSERWERKTE